MGAVRQMRGGKAPGPSGITSDVIKGSYPGEEPSACQLASTGSFSGPRCLRDRTRNSATDGLGNNDSPWQR